MSDGALHRVGASLKFGDCTLPGCVSERLAKFCRIPTQGICCLLSGNEMVQVRPTLTLTLSFFRSCSAPRLPLLNDGNAFRSTIKNAAVDSLLGAVDHGAV